MSSSLYDDFEFETLKRIQLDMSHERSLPALLNLLVERLRTLPEVALARIWLIRPGDLCDTCPSRPDCPDQTNCLHLVASAASPLSANSGTDWFQLDGSYRRYPLGVRHIGGIGQSGESMILNETAGDPEWFARGDWLQKEAIESFAGHPLAFGNDVFGVLGVFRRALIDEHEFAWLRAFADHAAASIANAKAFEEIERLKAQVELENEYLQEEVRTAHTYGGIVRESAPLRKVLNQVSLVAPTDSSVLILGESGTGKELVARAIHEQSRRSQHPMVKVNCAAIPKDLFESEFFGHTKGAFTGAVRDRVGRFQLAHQGTLFLDEIAEIPLDLQGKLLRVLQEGTFERVGDAHPHTVDVRVIAATNQSLEEGVKSGQFRQDLYYRLNVFPITVAPLRERPEDIPALTIDCIEKASRRMGIKALQPTKKQILALQSYQWPGNVRELQNVIERALITARSGRLELNLPAAGSAAPGSSFAPG